MGDRLRSLLDGPMAGHAAMLVFSAMIAGSFALVSLAAPYVAATVLNTVRFALASTMLGAAALATVGIPGQALRSPWRYAVLGGLMGIYFVMMFKALKTVPPVNAAAIFTLTPIMSGVFGYLILRQIFTTRITLALAIGAAGALWVIFQGDITALLSLELGRGEIIFFWGCISHALYTPLVRKLNRGENPIVFSFGALVAATFIIALAGIEDLRQTEWAALPGIVWITILYTAIFATAATFVLLQFATLRLPSAKVMAYTYVTPSWVICWQVALGEALPPALALPGVALSFLALVILLKDENHAT